MIDKYDTIRMWKLRETKATIDVAFVLADEEGLKATFNDTEYILPSNEFRKKYKKETADYFSAGCPYIPLYISKIDIFENKVYMKIKEHV